MSHPSDERNYQLENISNNVSSTNVTISNLSTVLEKILKHMPKEKVFADKIVEIQEQSLHDTLTSLGIFNEITRKAKLGQNRASFSIRLTGDEICYLEKIGFEVRICPSIDHEIEKKYHECMQTGDDPITMDSATDLVWEHYLSKKTSTVSIMWSRR